MHPLSFYNDVKRYLDSKKNWEDASEEVKKDSERYTLREGKLWQVALRTPVLTDLKELHGIMDAIHKDLGHYGSKQTERAVRMRYEVAKDIWEDGKKIIESCIPCQLFKHDKTALAPATLHPLGTYEAFTLWEIDFVGPMHRTPRGNRYLIIAIDYLVTMAQNLWTNSTQHSIGMAFSINVLHRLTH